MNGYNTFNYIRQNASARFQELVPEATEDNISRLGNILFNDQYEPQLNEFVHNLINRIGLTIIRNKSTYNNPLEIFKKGSVPLGTDIQDLYENPAEKQQYELSNKQMAKVLTITDPDTHVAYYRRNRQDYYTKSISREALQGAFVSWETFNEYITNITNSLYSGNYIDEFEYTKDLIDGAYDNNKVIMEEVTAPTTPGTAKAIAKMFVNIFKKFKFPSTKYNAYSLFSGAKGEVKTWTTPERIVIIARSDIITEIDFDVLAVAFNIDKASLMGRVYEIDEFKNPEILGVICDESWLQIYDNLMRFDEQYNGAAMVWNEYLHVWGTYALCPFANAIMLVTKKPVIATNISFNNEGNLTVVKGEQKGLDLTITPTNATTNINYTSANEQIFTVSKTSELHSVVTGISEGTATLFAKSDNGLTAEVTIEVTASA